MSVDARPTQGRAARLRGDAGWLTLLLVPLPLLLAAFLWPRPEARTDSAGPDGVPALAPCRAGPELTVVVLDVSASVIGRGGADPSGRSFEEARAITELLARRPCSPDDRFGVVVFADDVRVLPPTPLTSTADLAAALRPPAPQSLGRGTRLDRAVGQAGGLLAGLPAHRATLVVLSDMKAEDGAAALRAELDALPPATRHMVALGAHDLAFDGEFDQVVDLGRRTRPGAVARALVDAINHSRTRSDS